MKKIMTVMMLSCRKATELVEKRAVQGLTTTERIRLRVHLSMCRACSGYEHQSQVIDKALTRLIHQSDANNGSLNEDTKEQIRQKIREMKKNKE